MPRQFTHAFLDHVHAVHLDSGCARSNIRSVEMKGTFLVVMLVAAFAAEASQYSFSAKDCTLDRFTYTDAEMWIAFTGPWILTSWRPDQPGDRYRGVDRYLQLKRPRKYSDSEWKAFCGRASALRGKKASIWFGYSGVIMAHGKRDQVHLLHLNDPLDSIEIEPIDQIPVPSKQEGMQ